VNKNVYTLIETNGLNFSVLTIRGAKRGLQPDHFTLGFIHIRWIDEMIHIWQDQIHIPIPPFS